MKDPLFKFKQFNVEQPLRGFRVNTDGVLLGGLAGSGTPATILDLGTGTGVIALMLAQRFPGSRVTGVELDEDSALLAEKNFMRSPFSDRLKVWQGSIHRFFSGEHQPKTDLIVSNPPFFIDSLPSPHAKISLAKHTGEEFFSDFYKGAAGLLTRSGQLWMILPPAVFSRIGHLATQAGLFMCRQIRVYSFAGDEPVRLILAFEKQPKDIVTMDFVIYEREKTYTNDYRVLLTPFLTIF